MKLTVAAPVVGLLAMSPFGFAADQKSSNLRAGRNLQAEEELEGTFVLTEVQYEDRHEEEAAWTLALDNGELYDLEDVPPEWAAENGSTLKSGQTKLKVKVQRSNNGRLKVKGKPELTGTDRAPGQQDKRRLAVTGSKTILAIRVIAKDGTGANVAPTRSLTALSDDVFGTNGDPVNLKSQYAACSHDKLILNKAADRTCNGSVSNGSVSNGSVSNVADGVMQVEIPTVVSKDPRSDYDMRNAVATAVSSGCGVAVNTLANHVMYCLPKDSFSGIAYAGVGSWYSVYNDQWCHHVSGQLHELGHNLYLAHSNEQGTYRDQSGFMGYSYSRDDDPMCFNAAKNYQLGWFDDKFDQVTSPTGLDLYGIEDYSDLHATSVGVRMPGDSFSLTSDYFVSFNRANGANPINKWTQEGANQVLVHSKNAGTGYAVSELLCKISATGCTGQACGTGPTCTGGGLPLEVKVNSITLTNDPPAFADVQIGIDVVPPPSPVVAASEPPSKVPTPGPTLECTNHAECDDTNVCTLDECHGDFTCRHYGCDANASCQAEGCVCNGGYEGDGFSCSVILTNAPSDKPSSSPTEDPASPIVANSSSPSSTPSWAPSPTNSVPADAVFGLVLVTDQWPGDTSWNLKDSSGTTVLSGGGFQASTTYTVSETLDPSECYTFTILDSWGDGLCCSYGNGRYEVTFNGDVEREGGAPFSSESVTFGNCGGVADKSSPSSKPSASPVVSDSSSPSSKPSASPVVADSSSPSSKPSASPVVADSSSPSSKPSASPVVSDSSSPSSKPSASPVVSDSSSPSSKPSASPVVSDSSSPSSKPSASQVVADSSSPSSKPSASPVVADSSSPSSTPSWAPPPTNSMPANADFELLLVTDQWPGDTSWDLKDSSGTTVLSGVGPFDPSTTYTVSETLDPSECYTFTIFDSWGDGLCCSYGNGSYKVTFNGTVVKEGGQFGGPSESVDCGNC